MKGNIGRVQSKHSGRSGMLDYPESSLLHVDVEQTN